MNKIPFSAQEKVLKLYFPDSHVNRNGEMEIIWQSTISPTPLSALYTVKLHHIKGKWPEIYVVSPKPLLLAQGCEKLPHVYSTPKQKLCLFFPDGREWNSGMYYAKTLIPWTSEWLYHYEIWVGTGKWNGGGIDHETTAEGHVPINN